MDKNIQDLNVEDQFINFYSLTVKLLKKTDLVPYKVATSTPTKKVTKDQGNSYRFNCLFIDVNGDYIEAICFVKDQYEKLEEQHTYKLQKFDVQAPNRQYSFYDVELNITQKTSIILQKDTAKILKTSGKITPIAETGANMHASIEGVVIRATIFGAQKNHLYVVKDDSAQIEVKCWTRFCLPADLIPKGTYIRFVNLKFEIYGGALAGNTQRLWTYDTMEDKNVDVQELISASMDAETMNMSKVIKKEEDTDDTNHFDSAATETAIREDITSYEQELKNVREKRATIDDEERKIQNKILRLKNELTLYVKN